MPDDTITNTTTVESVLQEVIVRLEKKAPTPETEQLLEQAYGFQEEFSHWEEEPPPEGTTLPIIERVMRVIADAVVAVQEPPRPSQRPSMPRAGRRTPPQIAVGQARLSSPDFGSDPPISASVPPAYLKVHVLRPAMMRLREVHAWSGVTASLIHMSEVDEPGVTLLRFDDGGELPSHTPLNTAVLYVLSGKLVCGNVRALAGECLVAPMGRAAESIKSVGTATALLFGPVAPDLAE